MTIRAALTVVKADVRAPSGQSIVPIPVSPKDRPMRLLAALVLGAAALAACSKSPAPAAPADASTTAAATTATPAPAPASVADATPPANEKGEHVYKSTCSMCHGTGAGGSPTFKSKDEWGPRIAQGKPTLYTHALQGFTGQKGTMPARGGNASLSDDDVKAAVDYMVAAAQ